MGTEQLSTESRVTDHLSRLEAAHRQEDVESYVELWREDAIWVTSRGVCVQGRAARFVTTSPA